MELGTPRIKEQHICMCRCWDPGENAKTEGDVNPCKAQATKKEKEEKKKVYSTTAHEFHGILFE